MLRDLALASLVLAVTSGFLLAVLVTHRVTLTRRDHRSAESRLTPLALAVTFEDGEIPALCAGDAAILATLLGRFSSRLQGDSRARISEYFARNGHVRAEVEKLSDPRAWRRATAAYVLGDMGSHAATTALIYALEDPERDVRAAAARSLGQLQAPQGVVPLVAALVARRVPRGIIGQALLTVGPGAVERLLALLVDPDPEVRATAVALIGLLGATSDTRPVIQRLRDPSASVREQAALALGRLGAAAACDTLERALTDRAPRVQAAAAEALGVIGDPRTFTALLDVARSDSFAPARAAAHALARIDPARLAQAARRPDAGVHVLEAADAAAVERGAG